MEVAFKAVASHILLENAYESNLVPNIANVDYLEGNLGRTHLEPLSCLPTFVDDVYVFGYLQRGEFVFRGKRIQCTSGDDGSAKILLGKISLTVREAFGSTFGSLLPTAIVHTVSTSRFSNTRSAIRSTIARIQRDTKEQALSDGKSCIQASNQLEYSLQKQMFQKFQSNNCKTTFQHSNVFYLQMDSGCVVSTTRKISREFWIKLLY